MRIGDVITGTADDEATCEISVYPDATQSQFTIEAPEGIKSIAVIDASGRVYSKETFSDRRTTHQVQTASLAKGVYVIVVVTNSRVHTAKFVR